MGKDATMKAAITGTVLQALMVIVGKFVPSIGQIPNVYAISGTVLAAVTGVLFARWSPGVQGGPAAMGGAIAGGTSSVLGGALAAATGQWPGFQIVQILFPALSGGLAGGIGAVLGRLTSKTV